MLAVVFLSGTSNANFYYAVLFIPNYLNSKNPDSFSGLFLVTSMFCLIPLVGWILDKFDRKKMMLVSCIIIAIFDLFLLPLLSSNLSSLMIDTVTVCYAVILSFVFVVANIFVLEVFPPECRFSCGAVSYSVGAALLGGTSPMICSLLVKSYENNVIYLSAYISSISVLGVIGSIIMLVVCKNKNN